MPLHDWTKVDAGLFHAMHLKWIATLTDQLNSGVLPEDYYALPEQKAGGFAPDVLALKVAEDSAERIAGGLAVATSPPQTAIITSDEEEIYAVKANRIAIHHQHGEVVSIIEIVSPGNKSAKSSFAAFVDKSVEFISQRVHLLVIDVFPPTRLDPCGVHKAIWDEFREEPFTFPPGKDRLLASYDAGPPRVAYVEPIGVGAALPAMPLFLRPEVYVPAPLEESYQTCWNHFPKALKHLLES